MIRLTFSRWSNKPFFSRSTFNIQISFYEHQSQNNHHFRYIENFRIFIIKYIENPQIISNLIVGNHCNETLTNLFDWKFIIWIFSQFYRLINTIVLL